VVGVWSAQKSIPLGHDRLLVFDDVLFTESTIGSGLLQVPVEFDPSVPDSGNKEFFRLKIVSP